MSDFEEIEPELDAVVHQLADSPENHLAAVDRVVVMYHGLDADGDEVTNWHVRGDMKVSGILGMIEVCKIRISAAQIRAALDEAD